MQKKIKVVKNALSYLVIGVLPFAINFLLLPVYTRYLSPEDYGNLALVNAFGMALTTFVSFQLCSALPRFYTDIKEHELGKLLGTLLLSVVVISLSLLIIIGVLGDSIIGLLFPKANMEFYPYFIIAIATVFFGEISILVQRLLTTQERGGALLLRTCISQFASVVLGLLFVVFLDMGVIGALSATFFGAVLTAALNLFLIKKCLKLIWDKAIFKRSFAYSWPLVPHAIGGYLFLYADLFVLEKFMSVAAIGIYAIANRFSDIIKLITKSIFDALLPSFFREAKIDQFRAAESFRALINKFSILIALCCLGMSLLADELIIILTPAVYHSASDIIPILSFAYIFRWLYNFAVAPLFYLKKTKIVPMITFLAGAVNIVMNIILIPLFGLYGAVWATVCSFMLTFVLAYATSIRYFPLRFAWSELGQIFTLMFVIYMVICWLPLHSIWVSVLVKLVGCFIFLVLCLSLNLAGIRSEAYGILKNFNFVRGQ